MTSEIIDDGVRIIPLFFRRQAGAFVEHHFSLPLITFPFLRLRNRGDKIRSAATFNYSLGGLTMDIQLPVPRRQDVRGVKNGITEKLVTHAITRMRFLDLASFLLSQ